MLTMRRLEIIIFILFLLPVVVVAQSRPQLTQTVHGMVKDKVSGEPLPAISIYLDNKQLDTSTDEHGQFVLHEVPIGRHTDRARGAGYETAIITEVLMGTGTELNPDRAHHEKYIAVESAVITHKINYEQSLNPIAIVGALMFSVHQANCSPGGMANQARSDS